MLKAVKDFKDLTELFVVEPDKNEERTNRMTGLRKKTPEILDKVVQFIWDYQQKHDGATPKGSVIAKNVGVKDNGIYHFINSLVDSGRINKIAAHPFRATITSHPKNASAIGRYKRLLATKESFEAAERDRIRAMQSETAAADQVNDDKQALASAAAADKDTLIDTAARGMAHAIARPAAAVPAAHPTPQVDPAAIDAVSRFLVAKQDTRTSTRDMKAAMPQLVKIADTRDLMFELVERGFVVSKR